MLLAAVVALVIGLGSTDVKAMQLLERTVADLLYARERTVSSRIKIIAIDDKTEQEYGRFTDWSRQRAAELVEALNQPGMKPAVIGFDINYFSEKATDPEGDAAFVRAAEAGGNVVTASMVDFRTRVYEENGSQVKDALYAEEFLYPYKALRQVSRYGFSNRFQDVDDFVRFSLLSAQRDGETMYNFSYEVYRTYCDAQGIEPYVPDIDEAGLFGIRYVAKPDHYDCYSWADVVSGKISPAFFKDAIVLVGAYAAGMQDQYSVPVTRDSKMYGVEIHANIIDSLCREESYHMAQKWCVLLVNGILCVAYFFLLRKAGLIVSILSGLGAIGAYLGGALLLYEKGIYVYPVAFVISILLMLVVHMVSRYMAEWMSKRRILKEFKKYVAPQVLDQMRRDGELSIKLGGESREIAVLFVDIRGFTTLSEALDPEQVVEMLNEYLALTTEAIFANGGTLDKFIGDATMAVFNAPIALPDYEAKAVQAALDIVHGAEKVNMRIKEKIGREVSFGVGVHCGKAVVGNIGCETRMDYTAIGDTVNTASRLEGKALGGQVVISGELRKRLDGRILTEPLGGVVLKGKAEPMEVHSVLGFATENTAEESSGQRQ